MASSSGTVTFYGGNNITLVTGASKITISGGAGGAETQTAISGIGNSETTYTSGTVSLSGGNNITVQSGTGQRFIFSGPNSHAQQTGISGISNSETTYTSGTVGLSVVGGPITIRSTTGNAFQFSVSQSVQAETQTFLAGLKNTETTYTSGTVELEGTNNITVFSTTGQRFRISGANTHAQQTAISGLANSETTYTSGTVSLSVVAGNLTIRSTTGQAFQFSASQTVQTQNMVALSATNTLYSSGTVVVTGSNMITVKSSAAGQTIILDATQSNQSVGLYMSSNTTSSVSSGTVDARSLTFRGMGILSAGYSNGEVILSVPSGGGAGDGGNTLVAGTRTAGTSTSVVFSNSNGVSFGLDANPGSVMTASVNLNATASYHMGNSGAWGSASSSNMVNTTVSIVRIEIPQDLTFTRIDVPFSISTASSATTNTAAIDISYVAQLLTRNASTLTPILGTSSTTTYTWASNSGVAASLVGPRLLSFPMASLITPGEYYFALQMSSHSGSSIGLSTTALSMTMAPVHGHQSIWTAAWQDMSAATNQTINPFRPMQGLNSVSISNTTMTHQMSQITATGTAAQRANIIPIFRNI